MTVYLLLFDKKLFDFMKFQLYIIIHQPKQTGMHVFKRETQRRTLQCKIGRARSAIPLRCSCSFTKTLFYFSFHTDLKAARAREEKQ
jgi:hypothetical protein